MPYASRAQAGYFNSHRAELEAQGVDVDEWNAASKGMNLPARAKGSNMAKKSYSAKAAAAGKDIGKKGKNFSKIARKFAAEHPDEGMEGGNRVAGAILARLRGKR